jgi:hypothetical protein
MGELGDKNLSVLIDESQDISVKEQIGSRCKIPVGHNER